MTQIDSDLPPPDSKNVDDSTSIAYCKSSLFLVVGKFIFVDISCRWDWEVLKVLNKRFGGFLTHVCLVDADKSGEVFIDSIYLSFCNYNNERPLWSIKFKQS